MMSTHGCMGFFFFSKFDIGWMRCGVNSFSSKKVDNHSFRTLVAWLGWKKFRGLGLKVDTKIHNVRQNISLVMVFCG
jgi:hypothetical protein